MRDTSENNSPAVHKLPTENKQLVRTSPLRMSRSLTVLNPPTPSNPLVSIIMPVYNVSEWLDRSIYSALTQTYRNIEVIMMSGLFMVNPPKTNPKPVMNPTAKFPIKGVVFNLYAYR